jgi:hypothetical protein
MTWPRSKKGSLVLTRRVLSHVDHILSAVVDISCAGLQRGGVRVADNCLVEARLSLINDEVSRGALLAPENLALKHAHSMPPR